MLWLSEKNGLFTGRSTYRVLTNNEQTTPTMYKLLWSRTNIQPQILHFVWRCLNDALTTNARRAHVLPRVDVACPLLHNEEETITNLLLAAM